MKKISDQFEQMGLNKTLKKNLLNSYQEAMTNKDFKALVEKLNMDSDLLMKYTSLLEESSIDYGNCQKCKNILECKNKITGYAYLPIVVDTMLEFGYQPCRYERKRQKETKHLSNVYLFDIPQELRNAKMSDIYSDDENRYPIIKWLNNFIKKYNKNLNQKGLYLHGSFGSGKTYLISALFNELAHDDIKSAIVYWPEYLRDLKSSFQTDFSEKFEYVKKTSLLLIDDIGAEVVTEWGRDEILGSILQHRMQQHLPTFFTSNFDLKTLEKHLSTTRDGVSNVKARRIIERINQLTEEQEIISKNLRK
ncbi:MAG: primosomal protein DnaI [Bacilli bacterium]|nr:primosomal protein DnaI [Bacilli bacterium]MDD4282858.1 primosomal protein DnaI [Bacilli bacterium]MDD4718675.1 primosomal protein DnaI [Bacilli bacterium]